MKKTKDIPRSQRRWVDTNLAGARFHNVDLTGAKIRGAMMINVDIDGWIPGLRVNGVEVAPLVEKELERIYPERSKLRSGDPADLREAWSVIEKNWKRTMARARRLPEAMSFERVDDEWSLAETLRHLIFVTDAWLGRTVLGRKNHYDPMGLTNTDQPVWFGTACRLDPKANPTLAAVLEARRKRMATVRDFVKSLTREELDRRCRGNTSKGYPADPKRFTVKNCIGIVLNEEWEHHRFAVRDLDQLLARHALAPKAPAKSSQAKH